MNWFQYAVLSSILTAALILTSRYSFNTVDIPTVNLVRAIALLVVIFMIWRASSNAMGVTELYNSRGFWYVIAAGVIGVFSWYTYYEAMNPAISGGVERTTVATAINETYVLIVAIYEMFFLRKSFDWPILVGAVLVVLGIVVMTLKPEHWRALARLGA